MEKRVSMKVVLLCVAVAFALTLASAASAQPGKFVKGVLQPLEDGFPNRPIILMVVDDVGSADSLYATLLADSAKKMSPQPILIEHRADFSNFGTWEALAWVMDQGKLGNDGYINVVYTYPGCVVDLVVIDMKKETGLDLNDLNPVVSTETALYFIIQRINAPWGTTMQDFLAHAKKNPGTMRYMSGGPGSGADAAVRWYMKGLGFTAKEIIVGSSSARALGVASGDGDFALSPADVCLPHIQAGKVRPLMTSALKPQAPPFDKAVTSASLGMKDDPWGNNRSMAVSPKTPEPHRAWLETLFTAAATDKDFVEKRSKMPGMAFDILGKEATLKKCRDAYDFTLPIYKEMGLYWGDKKK